MVVLMLPSRYISLSAERVADSHRLACGGWLATYRLGVSNVVGHNLGHLGEVPAIPLTHTHGVCVELLVQIIQQTNSLRIR